MTNSTTPHPDNNRWEYIKHLWNHEYTALWLLPGILTGLFVGFALGWLADNGITGEELRGLIDNFLPEAIGIGLTVTILYYFDQWREDRREEKRLKGELLRQLGSRVNDTVLTALDQIREKGWHTDGTLRGIYLKLANLQGADLEQAHLQGANLQGVNLQGADLDGVCLQGANLQQANLQGVNLWWADLREVNLAGADLQKASLLNANLRGADLQGASLQEANLWRTDLQKSVLEWADLREADLRGANLQGASLQEANLQGACLEEVNLQGTYLQDVKWDERVMLPDGTYWTSETDMTRFTDPNHP
jgi:uncharacterized protein YjbI with pentapeptide repeats